MPRGLFHFHYHHPLPSEKNESDFEEAKHPNSIQTEKKSSLKKFFKRAIKSYEPIHLDWKEV